MEGKMSFPDQFIGSVFNFDTYRHFYTRSLGRAFLYLFLASIILGGLGGLRTLVELYKGIEDMIAAMESDMPYFQLRNGELYVDVEMPYVISGVSEYIFIIDTTGQTAESILDDYDVGILLTSRDMYQKQSRFVTRHYDLSIFSELNITRDDLIRWMPALKWVVPFMALFGFFFYFLGRLIGALIVALGGLIIENASGCKIGFGNLYKLSMYTLTLPMIIQAVLNLARVTVPLFFLFFYGIALFYLYRAVTTVAPPGRGGR